ncbi:DUF1311 domain-containing protein [Pseudoalteromonas sp. CO325X]|uniref:MliC family protein n=1 Tax=Pseudoalteromonas sp. CO325X TaxID=1777262 RepID=UPI0010235BBA|nr:MliC family protein [Pseudoalteromonas sp. CO325X]RZF86554.1 DUF1311 domain-containing protein [Pseudoalteromonas sp. CO325X]
MKRLAIVTAVLTLAACHVATAPSGESPPAETPTPTQCTQANLNAIEQLASTSDGSGHGPDIGTTVWANSVEYRLDINNHADKPPLLTPKWCQWVASQANTSASFNCEQAHSDIARQVCQSPRLSELDAQLADTFEKALAQSDSDKHKSTLRAMQRGWIKGRDACWQADNVKQCIIDAYQHRNASLQVQYQLTTAVDHLQYDCEGKQVSVDFYDTTPQFIALREGEQQWLMQRVIAASGAKYQGRNQVFWQKGDSAFVQWQYNTPMQQCTLR